MSNARESTTVTFRPRRRSWASLPPCQTLIDKVRRQRRIVAVSHGEQAAITFSGLLFGTQPTGLGAAAAHFLPPAQQRFVTDVDPRRALYLVHLEEGRCQERTVVGTEPVQRPANR